jgi:glycosyltransferase involved in cell wall biosynthesis
LANGDAVNVWTTTAVKLAEMWGRPVPRTHPIPTNPQLSIQRFQPITFPFRRYILKALSLVPHRPWQLLTSPSNPISPAMWRAVRLYSGPLDVVHATAFPYGFPLMCGLRLARRRKVPFLLTPFLHLGNPLDSADRTRKQYTRSPLVWLLKQADCVFVQTPSEYQLAAKLGVPESRLVLQGLGVNSAECTGGNRAKVRAKWGVADGTFVVGHLANNSVEKGTLDLWAAGDGKPFQIVLAGPEMPNFTWVVNKFGTGKGVTRLGVLSEEQKRDFYAGIDAFCLPSRTDSFGLVLLEAWANGKPVVVYRAGGPADIVRDGIDGFIVPCDDIDELAARLMKLATEDGLAAKMGEFGRLRLTTEFQWSEKLQLVRDTMMARCGRS